MTDERTRQWGLAWAALVVALAPGALSSPLLLVAAVALVTTTFRAGQASQGRRSGFD